MQEKPPFSSYFDFSFLTYGKGTPPSHTHPLRTLILPSATPLAGVQTCQLLENYLMATRYRSKGEKIAYVASV